jgi:ribosome-associated protein YbcJ (S4-like RNA binding protein)
MFYLVATKKYWNSSNILMNEKEKERRRDKIYK